MMESRNSIIFFGDLSLPISSTFSRLLHAEREHSLLSIFLGQARATLEAEALKLPISDRKDLPNLGNLHNLSTSQDGHAMDHPALSPALLVMLQLGQFIAHYEQNIEECYPEARNNLVVGICIGQISATAVSLARSLIELMPLAVESVRIAFRLGMLTSRRRNDMESSSLEDAWAMAIPGNTIISNTEGLKGVCLELGIPKRKEAYITAHFPKTVTIQGPPSTLRTVKQWLQKNHETLFESDIPIFSPYHASHLYNEQSISELLADTSVFGNAPQDENVPLIGSKILSPVTGTYYTTSSRRETLEKVLNDILRKPIHWDTLCEGCASIVASSGKLRWNLRPFGPTKAAKGLFSTLKSKIDGDILYDDRYAASKTSQKPIPKREPIAIVGLSGRFPESTSPEELWKLLEQGIDCHKVIPADRFDASLYVSQDADATNKSKSPYGCFIDEPGMFDPRFFNMSPREASQTDPQQRLALVTAYEALEMAGYVPNATPSTQLDRVGTFYGQTTDDYKDLNTSQDISTYYVSSVIRAFGPGRVSRSNQLGGPSVSVDTACSSSAMALNIACTSIWSQECDTAVVGGMLLLGSPEMYAGLSKGHFISETGPCKTFDDTADGYCRGEAVASIVIKRLDAAKADNDNILAVILGAGTNYSAYAASITQPHGPTQETLYRKILNQAGLDPLDIDYVEMHGTGTQLGDSVEMSSISNVFAPLSPPRPESRPLHVGSVKANIGHGESASGITSLIKALLIFQKERIPPHIGVKSGVLNRNFTSLKDRNVRIPLSVTSFQRNEHRKRRIVVNNFGAAGGNSAFILEEGPAALKKHGTDPRVNHIVSVTAKTAYSLRANAERLLDFLEEHPEVSISDVSYTTTARRVQHPLRLSLIASNINELKARVAEQLAKVDSKQSNNKPVDVAFAFTGQGSVYLSLGKQLYETSSQFRSDLRRFNQICLDHGFPSFLSVVDGSTEDLDIISPSQTQLALTSVQIALCRLWESWGVMPNLVIGHSLGEYAALCASGTLSVNDTLYLVGIRAALLEKICTKNTHSMLAIHANFDAVKMAAGNKVDKLELACINGPEDIVLSGLVDSIRELHQYLKHHGFKCTVLTVPYAFHSSQIDPILDQFEDAARCVNFMKPKIPVVSPLLCKVVREIGVLDATYLRRHARKSVDFYGALRTCQEEGILKSNAIWVEIGPDPICLGMLKSSLGHDIKAFPTLRKSEEPWNTAVKTMSALHSAGFDLNWKEYHRDFEQDQHLLHLPTYAFDEKKYWIEYKNNWLLQKGKDKIVNEENLVSSILGPATTTVQRLVADEVKDGKVYLVFESNLSEQKLNDLISGHSLNGLALCPSGVFADMALTVGDYVRDHHLIRTPSNSGINVADMEIMKPVTIPVPRVDTPQLLRIHATADLETGNVAVTFGLFDSSTQKVGQNAKCMINFCSVKSWLGEWSRSAYLIQKRMEDLERGVREGHADKIFRQTIYRLFSAVVDYDTRYQGMHQVMINSDELEAVALLKLYEGTDAGTFFCSPLWLDNLAQLAGFVMNGVNVVDPRQFVYISHGWSSYQLGEEIDPAKPYRVHVKMQQTDKNVVAGDVSIFQDTTMIGLCGNVKFQKVPRSVMEMLLAPPKTQRSNTHVSKKAETPSQWKNAGTAQNISSIPKQSFESSSQDTKAMALDIIAGEIGVPRPDLVDSATFLELGVDSLMSLTITSQIQDSLQINLPSGVFQDLETMGDFKAFLDTLVTDDKNIINTPSTDSLSSSPPSPQPLTPRMQLPAVDDILNNIYSIVAEQIGVEVEELLTVEDLSSLGLDSLMSLSIQSEIQHKLGLELQVHTTDGMSTLKSIQEAFGLSTPVSISSPQPTQSILISSKPSAPSSMSATAVLLQGNPHTASEYLFMFPDGSGSAAAYARLKEIAPNVVVYGLNSPFLKSTTEHTWEISEITSMMVREILSKQSRGPYLLAGWSAGGMYAFEAAKQLIQSGQIVSKLILIDSPCPLIYEPMPLDILNYIVSSGIVGGGPGNTAPSYIIDHFKSTIKALGSYSPTAMKSSQSPQVFIIWASKGLSEEKGLYFPPNVNWNDGVANWLLRRAPNPGPQGWERLFPSGIDISISEVAGNHFSMVDPSHSKSLSDAIADTMLDNSREPKNQWRKY